jgi:hypothetical protein
MPGLQSLWQLPCPRTCFSHSFVLGKGSSVSPVPRYHPLIWCCFPRTSSVQSFLTMLSRTSC